MKRLHSIQLYFLFIIGLTLLMIKPAAAIPAFLPQIDTVPAGEPMAIDGIWNIKAINKKIRYEAGRAYAVDDWHHMIVLHIQPGMVIQQNVTESTPGTYVSDDLPMLSRSTAKLQANGRIKYTAGVFSSELIPVELDYPGLMAETLQNLGGSDPSPQPSPTPSKCKDWAIDPDTNTPVCLD